VAPTRQPSTDQEAGAEADAGSKAAQPVPVQQPATDQAAAGPAMVSNASAGSMFGGELMGPVMAGLLTVPGVSNAAASSMLSPGVAAGADAAITPPTPGINATGFIDHGDGSNLRTGPSESGGRLVRPDPLPPATRVFVSGTFPGAPQWSYVTAFLDSEVVRGYVQGFRVTTDLPEPAAKLYQIRSGDTAEGLAAGEFGGSVEDGYDLRFYENVLLFVNRQKGRAGIIGSYQDPGILGGGANNVQLVAGHRIWLVSPGYATALKSVVPSGSLTGGAVAKARRAYGHLDDVLESITGSGQYLGAVAGEYAQAIRDNLPEIIGIVAGFVTLEMASMLLAATPTGVGQAAAVLIQLALAAFGAKGMVDAGVEALKHADAWLRIAWTANGDAKLIAEASREFLRMLVSIAMAALAYLGVKGNVGNAVTIAGSITPSMVPALAVAGGGRMAGAGALAPAQVGFPQPFGPFGTAMAMTGKDADGGTGRRVEDAEAEAKRVKELGDDPATGKHRPSESETAARIENERGVKLKRAAKGEKHDWVDEAGKTYDSVGNFDAKHFDVQWERLKYQIEHHLDKAEFVPVDVARFTPEQIAKIEAFITEKGLSPRVFVVGK
jgi:hypothetical protein